MLEVWFGVCLGLLLASSGALWYKFHTLETTINRSMNKVQESVEFPIDAIKDEISDTFHVKYECSNGSRSFAWRNFPDHANVGNEKVCTGC
jgi:hypothetical protein